MKNRFLLSLLLLMFFCAGRVCAENHYFEQISLGQGLSQSTVKVIFRDHIGLLWIGTKEGLNRYDGVQVRTYRMEKGKENSLPNNNIFFIAEDSRNNLWIGTGGTLCRYDRKKDAFVVEKINGKPVSLRNALVRGNLLYSATSTRLYIYDCETNTWTEKPFSGDDNDIKLTVKLENGVNGQLLVASRWRGLFTCDTNTGRLTRVPYFRSENILDVYHDSSDRIWVSEYGKGVFCYDKAGRLLFDLSKVPSVFRNDQVMDITQYQGRIWMVTDGNGVLVYSPEKKEFQKICHEQDNPYSLPVNSLLAIYTDKFNNLWLGTIRGGLIGVRKVHVQSYQNAPLNSPFGLSDQTVLSFFEDASGLVWVGTDGGGLNCYNPSTRRFTHFPSTYGKKISGITSFSDNELLMSLYKEGFLIFNKRSGTVRPFRFEKDSKSRILRNDWIGVAVHNGGNGTIYFADENVYAYSIATGKVHQLNVTSTGEGPVRFYSSDYLPGRLLLCSNLSVRIMNLSSDRVEYSMVVNFDSIGEINVAEVDKSGSVWLGTTSGLYVINRTTRRLVRVKPDLISSVTTFVFDKKQSLWIGVGLDLFRYSVSGRDVVRYGKSDGVAINEYLPKPRLRTHLGDVYLGGVSGFCRIDANIPPRKTENPVFELLDVRLDGLLLPEDRMSQKKGLTTVRIPWNYTSLVVNVFMNTRGLSHVKRARYMLEGLSDKYYELEKTSVDLQSLSPGTYTLKVQTELKNESWSEPFTLLRIKVTPPWWQTWWFFLLLLGAVAFALYRFRKLAIEKTKRDMEKEMQSHERELSEQKIRFLINISHELRTPLTLVYAPLRRLLGDEKTPEAFKPLLALMYKHVKNMKNMIDMVLDVRKMEMKHEQPNKQPHLLNEWMQGIADDFAFEYQARHVELLTEHDQRINHVSFDRNLCDKVLANLLMNALKFSDEGSAVRLRSELLECCVRISVIDQGAGIAPEDVPHLFTRFYQARHEKGGTGIGLSYARTQVELHGGHIGYYPAQPKGSVFWFELPLEAINTDISADNSEVLVADTIVQPLQGIATSVSFDKLSILIAEDEPDLLEYMKETLSPVFGNVITARNGDEALKKVCESAPDLVVSDVMMPVMDGFEFCRRLKTDVNISHIPVILLTALGDEDSSLTGYKMGADLYLSKPFGVDILLAILGNMLRTREELRKRYAQADAGVSTHDITFSNADERFMTRLLALIEERIDDPELRIDELAVEMAMSRTSFYNKVKLVTGISANAFIVDYKIKKAGQLLRSTDLPVQEIAMQMGFVSQRYFSTVFKQVTGKTPTRYRTEG